MKNLKNYAMALVALFIAATSVTLMSAGVKSEVSTLEWYEVDLSGNISNTPMSSPPSVNCTIDFPSTTCAIELEEDHSYTELSQVPNTARKAGKTD